MPGHFLFVTTPIAVILCCCANLINITDGASVEEYRLLQSILKTNYSTSVRPLLDQDDTVFVYSGFFLAGINEVDAVNQRLITTGFIELSWEDEFLQWDEDEFDIQTLYFKQVGGNLTIKLFLALFSMNDEFTNKIYSYMYRVIFAHLLLQTLSLRLEFAQTELCLKRNNLRRWPADNEDESYMYDKTGWIYPCMQYGPTVLAE